MNRSITMNEKIKIFISYSHEDEKYITEFEKYFEPIKEKEKNLEIWRDSQILIFLHQQSPVASHKSLSFVCFSGIFF